MVADLVGRTLGKYQLLERLGRGGMAEVYRAYQPSLEREVAIKVMHGYMVEEPDFVGRFKREAKAVSTLRHPHIVQVYDFDVEGDVHYMVMEYIEGETLKARLERFQVEGKRMSLGEVRAVFQPLCEALGYAHAQGRVHRDIKPANVMFDGERLVLTDFGIASVVGGTSYTAPGTMIGTPAYMSPEQCRGEPGDVRSDVYSLGIVLYELLTGQVPYDADTPLAIVLKHINDPLPLLRQVEADIPVAVERVVLKALAKSPDDRYQSAEELAESFCAAIREEIGREEIPGTPFLAVGATTDVVAAPSLLRRLWARLALAGAGVLLVAALVTAAALLLPGWLGTATPTALPVAVVTPAAVVPTAFPAVETVPPSPPPEAMIHYEAGVAAYESGDYEQAIQSFTEAIAAYPDLALAYWRRGLAYAETELAEQAEADLSKAIDLDPGLVEAYFARGRLYLWVLGEPELAWADLTRVIELDPGLAEAYLERARVILWTDDEPDRALIELDRALELKPELLEALQMRADIYVSRMEYDRALADLTRAVELVPEDAYSWYVLGLAYYWKGDYERSVDSYDTALSYLPNDLTLYYARGLSYLKLEEYETALEDFDRVLLVDPEYSGAHYGRGRVYAASGRYEEAVAEFTTVIQQDGDYVWPFFAEDSPFLDRALAYHALGKVQEALADLDTLVEADPSWYLPYYHRGLIYKEQGRTEAAIADFQALWEIAPDEDWRDTAEVELRSLRQP